MDPVFLHINASRHVLALYTAIDKLPSSPAEARNEIQAEGRKLARTLPYLRRALACYLCGGVVQQPVLVLECFHWSCKTCPAENNGNTSPSASGTAVASAVSSTDGGSTPVSDGKSLASGSVTATGVRRRSVRGGDLATYIRRCRWCEQKHTAVVVEMMRLLSDAYHCICRILLEYRHLLEDKQSGSGADRTRTRSCDVRGSASFLWRLVEESTGTGSAVRIDDDDLPGGVPPDDMFTGEYLRIKAQARQPDDRLLSNITSILSMYRYPAHSDRSPEKYRHPTTASTPAQCDQELMAASRKSHQSLRGERSYSLVDSEGECEKHVTQIGCEHVNLLSTSSDEDSNGMSSSYRDASPCHSGTTRRSRRLRSRTHRQSTSSPYHLAASMRQLQHLAPAELDKIRDELCSQSMYPSCSSTSKTALHVIESDSTIAVEGVDNTVKLSDTDTGAGSPAVPRRRTRSQSTAQVETGLS